MREFNELNISEDEKIMEFLRLKLFYEVGGYDENISSGYGRRPGI